MKRRWFFLAAGLGLYGLAAAAIALAGLDDTLATADLVVVPGNTVGPDGVVSERLKARLDVALGIYAAHQARTIFVSGGTGREGRDEAAAMGAYLVSKGIPPSAIVEDPLGVTTAATAANAAAYLRAHHLATALVATQYFHVARTALALRHHGVTVVGSRHARYFEWRDLYSLAREVPAYASYWLTA